MLHCHFPEYTTEQQSSQYGMWDSIQPPTVSILHNLTTEIYNEQLEISKAISQKMLCLWNLIKLAHIYISLLLFYFYSDIKKQTMNNGEIPPNKQTSKITHNLSHRDFVKNWNTVLSLKVTHYSKVLDKSNQIYLMSFLRNL